MLRVYKNLEEAQSLLPETLPKWVRNDMLLTLLFWKLLSDCWHIDVQQDDGDSVPQCPVRFDAQCDYRTCLTPLPILLAESTASPDLTGNAVYATMTRLTRLQPDGILNGVFRPERFTRVGQYAQAWQDPACLDKVLQAISNISVSGVRGNANMHTVFAGAMEHLPTGQDALCRELASLVVKLLEPLPTESLSVPACGHGELLLACINATTPYQHPSGMEIHAQEADQNKWALTMMQLLLRRSPAHQVQNTNYLTAPTPFAADISVISVPSRARDWQPDAKWADLLANHALPPVPDSRIALAWLAFINMKRESGRCALFMPMTVLAGPGGREWRQSMVRLQCLEAIIQLPGMAGIRRAPTTLLILLNRNKRTEHVAFIQQEHSNHQASARKARYLEEEIVNALQSFKQSKTCPRLFVVPLARLTDEDFDFDYQRYAPFANCLTHAEAHFPEDIQIKTGISLHQRRWSAILNTSTLPEQTSRGLLIVFTGDGKGKSSAAFGMGWRAVSHKMKVGVVQFLSGTSLDSTPCNADFATLGKHALCDFRLAGHDFGCDGNTHAQNAAIAKNAWEQAIPMLEDPSYEMIILDEINLLIYGQYLDLRLILPRLKARCATTHVVLTGRKAPYELIDEADMVTEMRPLKHSYPGTEIAPQAGIEF